MNRGGAGGGRFAGEVGGRRREGGRTEALRAPRCGACSGERKSARYARGGEVFGWGAGGAAGAHAGDDQRDEALADAVVVNFPDFPLAAPEQGIGLRAPLGCLRELGQEREDVIIQCLRAGSHGVGAAEL